MTDREWCTQTEDPETTPTAYCPNQLPWRFPARAPFPARPNHGYRGVTFDRDNNSWRARLYCAGRHITLGRYATAKLAAKAHDRAAYHVRGEGAVTNFGIAAARKDSKLCQLPFSPVLQRSLQAAAERLQAIGAAGGAKAGTQQRQPRAHENADGLSLGPINVQAAAARAVAATLAGAGPCPQVLRALWQSASWNAAKRCDRAQNYHWGTGYGPLQSRGPTVAEVTRVLVLAAVRTPNHHAG